MELLGYLGAIIMVFSLGLIGGGGSILTVPILVYLFDVHPVTAIGLFWLWVSTSSSTNFFCVQERPID